MNHTMKRVTLGVLAVAFSLVQTISSLCTGQSNIS